MGRGRQKAKHTKVARDLKYFSPDTNYGALEKELGHKTDSQVQEDLAAWPEYANPDYAAYEDKYADDLDDEEADDEQPAHKTA